MNRLTTALPTLLVLLALAGCSTTSQPTQLSATIQYQVSPCSESTPPDMENIVVFTAVNGKIQFEQDVKYVCCAEITLALEQDGDTLKVIETNEGEVCRCECGYHISATLFDLPATTSRIQVWGVQYQDIHPLQLLGDTVLPLPSNN